MPTLADVTFRLIGDAVDPLVVTEALKLQPSRSARKGERRQGQQGRVYTSLTNYWHLDSRLGRENGLEEHIVSLLEILKPQAAALKKLVDRGYRAEFFSSFFVEQPEDRIHLGADTLAQAGELGIALIVDIYTASAAHQTELTDGE